MTRAPATAKINLALVVGTLRPDGKHEVATVYQRVDLADRISVARADRLRVSGFAADTLVAEALRALAERAGVTPGFAARIEKRIPVAAGLAGGSSDAATALRLANPLLDAPLDDVALDSIARALGSDVPFFLRPGPQLGEADGSRLTPLELPQDYWVVLVLPAGETKSSTAAVYRAFDERGGPEGFDERRAALADALARLRRARDLASLPPNDLASSTLSDELVRLGAFRADVSGAGPVVYGLFGRREQALAAERALRRRGRTWITAPAWYF